MGTPFSDIYSRAIFKFSDTKYLKLAEEDREAILRKFLISAERDFKEVCEKDLDAVDEVEGIYLETLDSDEIEILALGVAFYWMSSKALDSELLKNKLSSKDFTAFSPANLLKEVNALRSEVKGDFDSAIVKYSYRRGDLTNPGVVN